ncbi:MULTISPECIES: alanine racemase [Synechococcus]|uniref:alanine racemase n=2 Tax=Synechococcus TaxID=1129 RepID=UPI0020CE49CC|nr:MULTISPECIES: alanine racemase [Synechococcus]
MSLVMHGPQQRAWVEINREAITQNTSRIIASLAADCQLMAVVKADGYGHGAVTVAQAALKGGASSFGVATLAEAIELRQAGIKQPVLVLGNLLEPEEFRCCLYWQLMPTISCLRQAQVANQVAATAGTALAVQLKLDTGMARLGAPWQEGPDLWQALGAMADLELHGLYSHLADADQAGSSQTDLQKQRFEQVLKQLGDIQQRPGFFHLANSAATLADRSLHYNQVRVGLAIYGHAPAAHLSQKLNLQAAMSVRARVTLIREVPSGVGVSYGHRFITKRPSRLAVLGIGYADGVARLLSGRMHVMAKGQRLPQVGNITMDQMVIDATDLPSLQEGEVVTLLGQGENDQIGPEIWSEACGTIPWEILCSFNHRLPRLPSSQEH